MSDHVIELNGKKYDGLTGAYLGKSHVVPAHIRANYASGKTMDGFMRSTPDKKASTPAATKRGTTRAVAVSDADSSVQQVKSKIIVRNTSRDKSQVNHLSAHRPQHSETLMQRQVRKPRFTMKTAISKAHAPVEIMAKPQSALTRKQSAYSVSHSRQERAVMVNKHPAIKHFTSTIVRANPTHVPVIAVQQPDSVRVVHAAQMHVPMPVKQHKDIFEKAIARATSHEQPMHKVRRRSSGKRRLINSLAVTATFLIIGGFVGYLNLPGIEMRVASMKAGFSASLPTYAPVGYSLAGSVERSDSTISVSFQSGSSQYRVTQEQSNWNSQTLLDNTITPSDGHQAVQKNGQIVYIYESEGTDATWVNGGIRYGITGNAELSKDEILSIATSL